MAYIWLACWSELFWIDRVLVSAFVEGEIYVLEDEYMSADGWFRSHLPTLPDDIQFWVDFLWLLSGV